MGKQVSKEELQYAVEHSCSIAQTLRNLGRDPKSNGRYPWIKKLIAQYGIDTSHFTGQG